MHLSPAAIESAIKLLDQPVSDLVRGDIGETGCVTWSSPCVYRGKMVEAAGVEPASESMSP